MIAYPDSSSATVEEQRARLPPAARCSDLVEGTWLATNFQANRAVWHEYTLEIRRGVPGGAEIKGEMSVHYWSGGDQDERPPKCRPGGYEVYVKMQGSGTVAPNGEVAFGSKSYVVDKAPCGTSRRYNPDNFTGKIDPDLQEFQSVNNDGGNAVNEPTVFRRIRCIDSARLVAPGNRPTPPSFAPPKRGLFSCGR